MKRFTLPIVFFLFSAVIAAAEGFPVVETLEPYIKNSELAGIVTIIADKESILQTDTVGYADIETKRPMQTDTFFWIASQSKPITAAAVMILVDEGKLSLKEPMTTYLPELKNLWVISEKEKQRTVLVPLDKPITLEMLLSHTSGWESMPLFQKEHGIDSLPLSQYVTLMATTPLRDQPGTAFHYSNVGIDLAGAIVERVAGMPFEQFLKERIFEPLGMTDTTFFPSAEQLTRLATVYTFDKKESKLIPSQIGFLQYPLDGKNRYAECGGGLFSTPTDLLKFFQMLARNGEYGGKRILSESAVKEIMTKHTGTLKEDYGLGIHTGGGIFGHSGALGTDTIINTNNGRVLLYFVQIQGLEKSDEAKRKFYKVGNR